MLKFLLRNGARAAARETSSEAAAAGAREAASAASEAELRAASKGVVHDSTSTAIREAAKTSRQRIRMAPSTILARAGAVTTIGATGFGLWKVNQTVDNVEKGIQNTFNTVTHLPLDFLHALDDLGLFNPESIQAKVNEALMGAHQLAGPAQTGVTIVVVLVGAVAAYEAYRFLR